MWKSEVGECGGQVGDQIVLGKKHVVSSIIFNHFFNHYT